MYPHLQNEFYHQKLFELNVRSFTILSCSSFNSDFVANVASFVFQSEFSTRLEILDLPTNLFSYIFVTSTSLVNLL